MYYRDEDGFGMTDDDEINLEGAINRKDNVVKKLRLLPRRGYDLNKKTT